MLSFCWQHLLLQDDDILEAYTVELPASPIDDSNADDDAWLREHHALTGDEDSCCI